MEDLFLSAYYLICAPLGVLQLALQFYADFWNWEETQELAPALPWVSLVLQYLQEWPIYYVSLASWLSVLFHPFWHNMSSNSYHVIYLFIILNECESLLFYSAKVIYGIHGCVYVHTRHEFLAQWNVIANGHPYKSLQKRSDSSCYVLHDLWPSKGVIFAKFISQNTSKYLEILCQCEYASPDNLYQLLRITWALQYQHIGLGNALRRYFMTILFRIDASFRICKLIVGRINWSYFSPLFLVRAPTDSASSVFWHRIYFEMYASTVYLLPHYVQQMDSARKGNRKSLDMTMFVTSQMNYYNAQQRVGYYKRKFGPHNQCQDIAEGGHVSQCSADLCYLTQATVCNWCTPVTMGTDAVLPHYVAHKGYIPVG